jgi:hypothetical protein
MALLSRRSRWGWVAGIANDAVWIVLAVDRGMYGTLAEAATVSGRLLARWPRRREAFGVEAQRHRVRPGHFLAHLVFCDPITAAITEEGTAIHPLRAWGHQPTVQPRAPSRAAPAPQ